MQAASGTIDLSLRLIASASMPEQKKEVKQRKRQAQAAELVGAKQAKPPALRAHVGDVGCGEAGDAGGDGALLIDEPEQSPSLTSSRPQRPSSQQRSPPWCS